MLRGRHHVEVVGFSVRLSRSPPELDDVAAESGTAPCCRQRRVADNAAGSVAENRVLQPLYVVVAAMLQFIACCR